MDESAERGLIGWFINTDLLNQFEFICAPIRQMPAADPQTRHPIYAHSARKRDLD